MRFLRPVRLLLVLEFSAVAAGLAMIVVPAWHLSGVLEDEADAGRKLHIGVNYEKCTEAREPLLSLRRSSEDAVAVELHFVNWRSFADSCERLSIDVNKKLTLLTHSQRIDGEHRSEHRTVAASAFAWDEEEAFTTIAVEPDAFPSFGGTLRFTAMDALTRTSLGYQISTSFGTSGYDDKLGMFRFVEVAFGIDEKLDFTVPAIYAIQTDSQVQRLTFDVDDGLETDIFTDVLVSVIDPKLQASRETSLVWLSAVLGSGVGLMASGLFAALRELVKPTGR